jgi:hypothetical protein
VARNGGSAGCTDSVSRAGQLVGIRNLITTLGLIFILGLMFILISVAVEDPALLASNVWPELLWVFDQKFVCTQHMTIYDIVLHGQYVELLCEDRRTIVNVGDKTQQLNVSTTADDFGIDRRRRDSSVTRIALAIAVRNSYKRNSWIVRSSSGRWCGSTFMSS